MLVNAIDDVQTNLRLVDSVRQHFPKLHIVARARNVQHYFELRRRGVEIVERETFAASLGLGRKALELLGIGRYEARERADRFRRHNLRMLENMVPHIDDEARRITMARDSRLELERQMEQESAQHDHRGVEGWQEESEAEEPRV